MLIYTHKTKTKHNDFSNRQNVIWLLALCISALNTKLLLEPAIIRVVFSYREKKKARLCRAVYEILRGHKRKNSNQRCFVYPTMIATRERERNKNTNNN